MALAIVSWYVRHDTKLGYNDGKSYMMRLTVQWQ